MKEIYIVDDDPLAIATLTHMLAKINDVTVVGSSTDPLEALEILRSGRIHADIILMDVEMKTMSGLNLAGLLTSKAIIIFISAHSQFAVDAFDTGAVYYILKPVSPEKLSKGIEKAISKMKENPNQHRDDFIILRLDGKNRFFKALIKNILYLEGAGNYTQVQLTDSKHLAHTSMTELMDSLPANKFIKIQKSYVINLDHMERISGNNIQMSNGIHLQSGEVYRKAFYERLNLGNNTR